MKSKVKEEYVQIDAQDWAPFPEAFSEGGIRWKLLHVSPEMGAWTAFSTAQPVRPLPHISTSAQESTC
jgi:hypothetical protein